MTQRKLDANLIQRLQAAKDALINVNWKLTSEGHDFWQDIYNRIRNKAKHGTTDGKPWVEPELTDEDAKQRPWVMVRQQLQREWTGPHILVCVTKERYLFTAAAPDLSETNTWQECRLATPEEIEAANADR
jgi:hypothetical protein